jgi:uncharacterized protein
MAGLIRLIVIGLLIYFGFKAVRWIRAANASKQTIRNEARRSIDEDLVEDPYCHRYIPLSQAHKVTRDGKALYFCSEECRDKYDRQN